MQKSKPLDPRCGIYTITPADAETLLTDPFPLFHQFRVHDGDLPGGPAKTDEPQLQPEAKRLRKCGMDGHQPQPSSGTRQAPACIQRPACLLPQAARRGAMPQCS